MRSIKVLNFVFFSFWGFFSKSARREPLVCVYQGYRQDKNSEDEDIEKWVTNHLSMKERALIADEVTAPGFEAEVVISIGSATLGDVFMSRARVQYIMVNLDILRSV